MADDATTSTTTAADTTSSTGTDDQGAGDQGTTKPRLYSKAELDGIKNKAVAEARRQFADYNELKAKAEEFDRLAESSKTETDKQRERADRAVRERDAAMERAKNSLVRGSIVTVASRLGCVDPEAVAALLPKDELVIEGDEVIGVEEAVKALLAKKPYLRAQGAQRVGAEIQGGSTEAAILTRSQIKKWARGEDGGVTPERQKAIDEAYAAGRVANR